MSSRNEAPKIGELVVLKGIPPGLLNGLLPEDQEAISAMVGKSVVLSGYDDHGSAELEFTDDRGHIHYIYVMPSFVRAAAKKGRQP